MVALDARAGFVYACCRRGCFTHVKIGFTTQNPHRYCEHYSRTLLPLQVISITPFSNARLAEAMVFHILNAYRTDMKHEVFDLSNENGLEDLSAALDHAAALDQLSDLPVPDIPAHPKFERKRKRSAETMEEERRQLKTEKSTGLKGTIRVTTEPLKRFSVLDLISCVTGNKNATKSWYDVKKHYQIPECSQHKFSGQGQQNTPVTTATGAVALVNVLPGLRAAEFRNATADIVEAIKAYGTKP